ncbi:DUF4190 domain-containing protein [Streptomyces achromogenes]|uniref:DUF4190 domain-containing protein n=1 Tax=Streptomyces achromogenes TaxID=67255 RepID=UPI0037031E0E
MSDEAPQSTPGERTAPVHGSATPPVSLDKEPAPAPTAPPADRIPGPVDSGADRIPGPVDSGADRAPVQDAPSAPASVHHQQTLASLPTAPEPPAPAGSPLADAPSAPWASPAGGTALPSASLSAPPAPAPAPQPNPFAPPAPAPRPDPFSPPAPAPNPFAPPAAGPPAQAAYAYPQPAPAPNPFALPAPGPAAQGHPFAPPTGAEPVPPPPIAPDGPGQVPYGYPGTLPAYGNPGPPHAPYAAPYPVGNGYGWPGLQAPPSNGMGTASLVLGILSDIGFLAWPLALILGVLAIIFGALGRGKAKRGEATNPGVALAGLICGATGVVLVLTLFAVLLAAFG